MNEITVAKLEPQDFWQCFAKISDIPRASHKEAAIIKYISNIAQNRSLSHHQDAVGNLLVRLPGSKGLESRQGLIIQGHVDMVCEKDSATVHDFDKDPIRLIIDGDWLKADHTTLGADNGIAIAMMLCLMQGEFEHGPIDLLFTIDEETGLTGAMNLTPEMLNYRSLINLDGEEENIYYIGCAGGKETLGYYPLIYTPMNSNHKIITIVLNGLGGGHSGADIHRQPGNALKLLGRFLWMESEKLGINLIDFVGGDKHNAICREAFCTFSISDDKIEDLRNSIEKWKQVFSDEFGIAEPALNFQITDKTHSASTNFPKNQVLDHGCQKSFINLLFTLPHGVLSMSRTLPGLVSSSNNLAAIRFEKSKAVLITSQRSDMQTLMEDAAQQIRAHFELAGATWNFNREYPSWTPQPESSLLNRLINCHRQKSPGIEPIVTSIHAGLECGVIGSRQPGMDMVSFGPDIVGAHTPYEKANIPSTKRVWQFLLSFIREF